MNTIIEQSKNSVVDLPILRAHLRIEHDHEDVYLKEIIEIATEILEKNIGKAILKKKYKYIFQGNNLQALQKIEIPMGCVANILSIKKIISKENKENIPFSIENRGGKTVVLTGGSRYPIEIMYRAGLANAPLKIPRDLRYAVLQIAKNIYDCSEEDILKSDYIRRVIDNYRNVSIN
jgi:uncharacterized phiE125 gp8 family phage protein